MNKRALRACVKFDPAKQTKETNGKAYLPLAARMVWFHTYLREQDKEGLIDDSALTYLPEAKLLYAVSSIYINGELAGRSCGGVGYLPTESGFRPTVGQEVSSMAKGRALSNAGFGTADAVDHPAFMQQDQDMSELQDGIRPCSYDPIPDMTFIANDNSDIPSPFLSVGHRVKWFHQWLKDNRTTGYIDDSTVFYDPVAKLLVAKAEVYVNGVLLGTSGATIPYDPDVPTSSEYNPVGTVCTKAKGRALANAGFGLMAMGVDDELDAVQPCEGGVSMGETPMPVMPPIQKQTAPLQPVPGSVAVPEPATPSEDAPAAEPKKRRGRKAAEPKDADTSTVADSSQMSREEALAYVIPVPGPLKGKTIGEALGMDRGAIDFYASDRFTNPKYAQFKAAAVIATK